jgi:polyisoprenoid-binding protein YceI
MIDARHAARWRAGALGVTTVAEEGGPMAWAVDPNHSSVAWSVRHYGIAIIRGYFRKYDARVNFEGDDPTRWTVEATIDAASIESNCEQRDHHLRSADYFEAETYPTLEFRSTRIERANGSAGPTGAYRITGDLTIHGVTRSVTLDAEFAGETTDAQGNPRRGFTATANVKRTDFQLGPGPDKPAATAQDVRITIDAEVVNRVAAPAEAH